MTVLLKKILLSFSAISLLFLSPLVIGKSSITHNDLSEYPVVDHLTDLDLSDQIEAFLQNKVPGLSVSYREIFDAIIFEGHDVYVKGGVIRDLLQNDGSQPVDVDFSFSCTTDELEAILIKHQWHYTRLPNDDVVNIGDRTGRYLEGVPLCWTFVENEYQLDFTANNILYHLNTKLFSRDSEAGIDDVRNRKLNVVAKDLKKWLYAGDPDEKCGIKIFRFWKMVAKGYVYTVDFEEFIYQEAFNRQEKNPEVFKEELIQYLAYHYNNYDEIVRGARMIMGNEWVEAYVVPLRDGVIEKEQIFSKELDEHTFFKTSH